jgi:hypothetical protein
MIEGWTLSWPEIRIPPYRTERVGAWELNANTSRFSAACNLAPKTIC